MRKRQTQREREWKIKMMTTILWHRQKDSKWNKTISRIAVKCNLNCVNWLCVCVHKLGGYLLFFYINGEYAWMRWLVPNQKKIEKFFFGEHLLANTVLCTYHIAWISLRWVIKFSNFFFYTLFACYYCWFRGSNRMVYS